MTPSAIVVDDDPAAQFIYEQVLGPLGFDVATASDGATALDLLRARAFHLITLDLLLPVVSGHDLIEYIHKAPHLQTARVMVVSAHPRFRNEVALGPNDLFLVKPVILKMIREVGRQVMATSSAEPQ